MMRSMCAGLLLASVLGGPAVAQPRQVANPGADLVPIPSAMSTGVVSVRNGGTATSPWTVATVRCHKPNEEGGCPELTPAQVAQYTDPAFPDRLAVRIPPISPGGTHNHQLSFWDAGAFAPGAYQFDLVVDAAAAAAETNSSGAAETNNSASYIWTKR